MTAIAPFVFWQTLDNNGDPLNGGTIESYEAGTTTPKDTFTDETGSTANTNPIVLDSAGRADIWLDVGEYKFVLKDSSGNLIKTVDNISGVTTGDAVSYDISTTTNIVSSYNQARIFATGTISLNLLPAADANDGFEFYVKNVGTGVITVNPDSSETINDLSTLTIPPDSWSMIYCDGDEWYSFNSLSVLNNLSATTAPTVNDDSDDGYSVGSLWIDTTADEAYRCADASAGAAVWLNTTLEISDLGNAATFDIASQAEAEAGTSSTTLMTPQRTKQFVDTTNQFLIMEHQEADGSSAGGITGATWNDRDLNTEITNSITGASTNTTAFTFTLPVGEYVVEAYAQGYACGTHQLRLRNTTDSTTDLLGTKIHTTTSNAVANDTKIYGVLTVSSSSKTFKIQQYATNSQGTNGKGFGSTSMDAVGIFARLIIRRIG